MNRADQRDDCAMDDWQSGYTLVPGRSLASVHRCSSYPISGKAPTAQPSPRDLQPPPRPCSVHRPTATIEAIPLLRFAVDRIRAVILPFWSAFVEVSYVAPQRSGDRDEPASAYSIIALLVVMDGRLG